MVSRMCGLYLALTSLDGIIAALEAGFTSETAAARPHADGITRFAIGDTMPARPESNAWSRADFIMCAWLFAARDGDALRHVVASQMDCHRCHAANLSGTIGAGALSTKSPYAS